MRKITFTAYGSSATFGGFEPGDTLRCSDEVARHFVEDACCARYSDEASPTSAQPAKQAEALRPAAKRARRATGA